MVAIGVYARMMKHAGKRSFNDSAQSFFMLSVKQWEY